MKDISEGRLNEVISEAGARIGELSLDDTDKFFLDKEKIIVSAIKDLGVTEEEPIFETIRAEFYRIIRFCPD